MEMIRSVYLCWREGAFGNHLLGVFKDVDDAQNMADACSSEDEPCFVKEERVIY